MTGNGSAIIGHTGFVGGTLARARHFDHAFNSRNIEDIRGRRFDEIVCAGVSAVKWMANKDPDADAAGVRRLTEALAEVDARRLLLISTIDVYPDTDRCLDETAVPARGGHAYGRHRLALEAFVRERFEGAQIVRLPALFGESLRKNALFDLLHDNNTGSINPAAVFQWYPMRHLAADLATVAGSQVGTVNLFPEPLETGELLDAFFPGAVVGEALQPAPHYDLQTAHAALFGRSGRYRFSVSEVLGDMARFIAGARRRIGTAPARSAA